jgi:hypothetical protein
VRFAARALVAGAVAAIFEDEGRLAKSALPGKKPHVAQDEFLENAFLLNPSCLQRVTLRACCLWHRVTLFRVMFGSVILKKSTAVNLNLKKYK